MIENHELTTYDEYVNIFNKKFKNFMQKSPCKVDIIQTPDCVIIKDKYTDLSKSFIYDFSVDVKQFINSIKLWLIDNLYPVIEEVKKEKIEYSHEDLQQMIRDNINIDEVLLTKKEKKIVIPYRIEKIILLSNNKAFYKKDRLFVRNLETNIESLYEIDMPGSVFLQGVLEKWTPEYSYQVFKSKSQFLNEIDPNYKKEEI